MSSNNGESSTRSVLSSEINSSSKDSKLLSHHKKNNEDEKTVAKKYMLLKDRVGITKLPTRQLPGPGHTYGSPKKTDVETAGEVMSAWITCVPSPGKKMENLTVATNILAVKHGCCTAKAVIEYGKTHTNLRRKEIISEQKGSENENRFEGPFGKQSVFSPDSMKDIVGGQFFTKGDDDIDYPPAGEITCKSKILPKPKATKATKAINRNRIEKEEKAEKSQNHFCMSKFQNIKGNDLGNTSPVKKQAQTAY